MVDQNPILPSRNARALMGTRPFGPFLYGKLVRTSGVWVQNVTSVVVAYQVTGSTLVVGLVSALQFIPSLVFTIWAGALADRSGRVSVLLVGQALSGCGAVLLMVWIAFVGVHGLPNVVPVLIVSLVTGLGFAITAPSMQALVPALVRARDLDQAVALSSLTIILARAIGPAIGAAALALGGAAAAYGLNVAAHVVFVIVLLRLRTNAVNRAVNAGVKTSVLSGLAYVRRRRSLWVSIFLIGCVGFAADPVLTLTPELGFIQGGFTDSNGAFGVALLVAAFGAGSIGGALVYNRVREATTYAGMVRASLSLMAVSLILAPLLPGGYGVMSALAISGIGFYFAVSRLTAFIHTQTSDVVRGRVMAIWTASFIGSRPIAALMSGAVADAFGLTAAFFLAALIPAAALLLTRRAWLQATM